MELNSDYEIFLILFQKLKKETNNSPNNLEWLLIEKPYLSDLCSELDFKFRIIKKLLIMEKNKIVIVPDRFFGYWNEYQNEWESFVTKCVMKSLEALL